MGNENSSSMLPANGMKRWSIIVGVMSIIAISGAAYWAANRNKVSTDDAQIAGDLVPINARTSGYVNRIVVDENDQVRKGQLLVSLDQRDLNAKLHSAEATVNAQKAQASAASCQASITECSAPALAAQAGAGVAAAISALSAAQDQVTAARSQYMSSKANIESLKSAVKMASNNVELADSQVDAAKASLASAEYGVTSAQANVKKVSSDYSRFKELFVSGATSRQQLDSAEAANTSADAALEQARENVKTAKAAVAQAIAKRSAAVNQLSQAKAALTSGIHAASQACTGVNSAKAAVGQANARVSQAQAQASGASTAPQQIAASKAQYKASMAQTKQAVANVNNAKLQLSYTTISSPVGGVVSQKSVQMGQYVQPGQMLMSVVPLKRVWVIANFKETQIQGMHPGDRAIVDVDTYSGKSFEGRVKSIGAATQASFSLLPSQNATGNFVKVVQRIPVKIVFDKQLPKNVVLRPGANVTATVIMR